MSKSKTGAKAPGPAAEPVRVSDLAAFQPGAIVSREVLRRRAGGVTVFAFAAGEALSEHTAPFDALALALEGRAVVTIGGRAHNLRRGEMILMPAGVPHGLKAVRPFKMALVMIRR